MSQNLQSRNLLESITQAKQRSLGTAMQTLQQQESAFNTALENVQKDLKADFSQVSQELIRSYKVESQQTLESLSTLMTSISQSNLKLMTTLERQSEKISEKTERSQASLLTLQSHENQLIETLEQRYRQVIAEALTAQTESNKAYLKRHKTLTQLPTLVMICLSVIVLLNMIGMLILVDYLEKWKNFSLTLGLIAFSVIIICGTWAWIENNRNKGE